MPSGIRVPMDGAAAGGEQPAFHLGKAEHGVRCGDDHVAAEQKFEPATGGSAVGRAHDRHGDLAA